MSETREINEYRRFMKPAELHKSVNSLMGILRGVALDGTINENEYQEIKNWCELQRQWKDKHPYNELYPHLEAALEDGKLSADEVEDLLWLCDVILRSSDFKRYYDYITSSIQELQGFIHGIMADGTVTDDEISLLKSWMERREILSGTYPYDEIYSLLVTALADRVISEDERKMLRAFFATFIDTQASYNIDEPEITRLQKECSIGGICAVCPEIEFEDRLFCFTGQSFRGTRKDMAQVIEENAGRYNDNLTEKTDYLIVGNGGNPCWAFACYGRKVEKAMQMRKGGRKIVIVHENDFWDAIG